MVAPSECRSSLLVMILLIQPFLGAGGTVAVALKAQVCSDLLEKMPMSRRRSYKGGSILKADPQFGDVWFQEACPSMIMVFP